MEESQKKLFVDFETWLDRILLQDTFPTIVAFNFNLYEHEGEFAMQLVGAESFDQNDSDWPCNAAFSTGENLFLLPHSVVGSRWQQVSVRQRP